MLDALWTKDRSYYQRTELRLLGVYLSGLKSGVFTKLSGLDELNSKPSGIVEGELSRSVEGCTSFGPARLENCNNGAARNSHCIPVAAGLV